MNKKIYSTPNTEVTRIEMQGFVAASITSDGSKGSFSDPVLNGDADEACGNLNISNVWE